MTFTDHLDSQVQVHLCNGVLARGQGAVRTTHSFALLQPSASFRHVNEAPNDVTLQIDSMSQARLASSTLSADRLHKAFDIAAVYRQKGDMCQEAG